MKIAIVADRVGWAIDKISKPLSLQTLPNDVKIDMFYLNGENRAIRTNYSAVQNINVFDIKKSKEYDIIHFYPGNLKKIIDSHAEGWEEIQTKTIQTVTSERDVISLYKDLKVNDFITPTKFCNEKINSINKKSHYIPYCVDSNLFNYGPNSVNNINVGFVGRIMEHKRVKEIVAATIKCDFKFLTTGYVDNRNYANSCKIPGGCIHNLLPQTSLIGFMRKFTFLASISAPEIETGPLAVLECAALGIPILTTPIGWAKDNLKHGESAYFVEHNDMANLHKHFLELGKNKVLQEKLRKNARQIVEKFNYKFYLNKHLQVYKEKYEN